MPATRHTFRKCGHKGFGANCHRCETAEKLQAKVANKKASEEVQKSVDEANRLLGPAKRKGGSSFTPNLNA